MKIIFIVFFYLISANSLNYPTKRWKYICDKSVKWANNKTLPLKNNLSNNLEIVYNKKF